MSVSCAGYIERDPEPREGCSTRIRLAVTACDSDDAFGFKVPAHGSASFDADLDAELAGNGLDRRLGKRKLTVRSDAQGGTRTKEMRKQIKRETTVGTEERPGWRIQPNVTTGRHAREQFAARRLTLTISSGSSRAGRT